MDKTKLGIPNFIYADDEPLLHGIIPELIREAFPDYTIACKVVDNGKKLLEEITSTKNLAGVVTDHSMPIKTGSQALLEARTAGYRPRAIIISGIPDKDLAKDYIALKDVPVMQKPLKADEFIAVLRSRWPEYAPR